MHAQLEDWSVPVFGQSNDQKDTGEPAVDPQRFNTTEPSKAHWSTPPQDWQLYRGAYAFGSDTRLDEWHINGTIAALPLDPRLVPILRDIDMMGR